MRCFLCGKPNTDTVKVTLEYFDAHDETKGGEFEVQLCLECEGDYRKSDEPLNAISSKKFKVK